MLLRGWKSSAGSNWGDLDRGSDREFRFVKFNRAIDRGFTSRSSPSGGPIVRVVPLSLSSILLSLFGTLNRYD